MLKKLDKNSNKQSINNVYVGENVTIYDFVNAYGCKIGSNTKIGTFVEIQRNVEIGENCKVSSHTFICEGVHIGRGVFIGHNVSFINDLHPSAVNQDGTMQMNKDWTLVETFVGDFSSIGTSSTILGGIKIGQYALIGAGSVVTRDVPDNAVVVGNPAKIIRYIQEGK